MAKYNAKERMDDMKKFFTLLLCGAMIFSFAACGDTNMSSSTIESDGSSEIPASSGQSSTGQSATGSGSRSSQSGQSHGAEPTGQSGKILIAYFSWSGNTEKMAQMIRNETGGELFEITPATPYTDDYNALLDVAQQEQADDARPELSGSVEGWDGYDVVFVGYPDWWSDAPMLVYSFLEAYDWTGKTLVPFCTSGGSGFGRSLSRIADSAPGAEIAEGLHLLGSGVDGAADEVASWIEGLDLSR